MANWETMFTTFGRQCAYLGANCSHVLMEKFICILYRIIHKAVNIIVTKDRFHLENFCMVIGYQTAMEWKCTMHLCYINTAKSYHTIMSAGSECGTARTTKM